MSRKARKNVGVIGLGIIGSRVAAGLRAAGYQVFVWNRSAKPAPNFLGSPAEVAEAADIIQIFVADGPALFEVIEAMGESLTAKHVIVCSATVGPEAVLEAAQIVEAKGAQFIDAPFTGSKLAAEKRQLVYYIGGSEHTFLKIKPVLEVTSKAIVRIGEVGHAATVKVVTNMISAVTAQVLAEALSIVQKAGLEPEMLTAAIEQNACRSGVIDLKLPKMVAGDYDPHFSLKHMFKDVQLGIHMANALDVEIPTTTVTAGVMYGALNQGWADLDFSVLFKNYSAAEPADEPPTIPELSGPGRSIEAEVERTATAPSHTFAGDNPALPPLADFPADQEPPTLTAMPGGSVPQAEPTAASAQMIDAVLAHLGVEESRAATSPEPVVQEYPPSPSRPEQPREPSADKSATAQEAAGPETASEGAEPLVHPNNFVRRWFVARSGS